ncbi:MAG: class I SAM-dependent methyltransferase [Gaiellaceae bacterium]
MDERLAAYLEVAALTDEHFVERVYRLILRRPPDADARDAALASLRQNAASRAAVVADLVASDEFRRLHALEGALARARAARETDERPHELTTPPRVDERPIELAWVLGRFRSARRLLDVGYAFAEPPWLTAVTSLGAGEVVGVDAAERDVPGLNGVVADVRELPFRDGTFDVVFCISTLEHVGRDNTRYGGTDERDDTAPLSALRELHRVTARRGRIFVTVPCGSDASEWYLREPPDAWHTRFRDADLYVYDAELYRETPTGWRSASASEAGLLCAELHPGRRRHELVRRLRRG